MASYPIPPWLHPYGDPGELFLQSQRLNASVKEAQQRLAEQHHQSEVETQMRRDALAQRAREDEQRLAIDQARITAYTSMRAHALDIAQQGIALKAQQAAQQFAASQSMARRIGAGEDWSKVALTTPGLGLTGGGIASLARGGAPTPNMQPQWTTDPQTGQLIGYNPRTGVPHYRPAGRAELPQGMTPAQREGNLLRDLEAQRNAMDKTLAGPILMRAEKMSEAQIEDQPKETRAGWRLLRGQAIEQRRKRDELQKQIEAIQYRTNAPSQAGVPSGVAAPPSLAARKLARAKQLADEHPDWTKAQILQLIEREFRQGQ
jgi:hypothetical protein